MDKRMDARRLIVGAMVGVLVLLLIAGLEMSGKNRGTFDVLATWAGILIEESRDLRFQTQADRDDGRRADGLTTPERDELVRLRREVRVAKLEVEILKRAAAYFAAENINPK